MNVALWNICECLTKLKQVETKFYESGKFPPCRTEIVVIKRTEIGILKCILREGDHERSDVKIMLWKNGNLVSWRQYMNNNSIHLVSVDPREW